MFARRVYELMASNTAIISNFSRGLRINFGDLIISSDSQSRLKSELIEFKPMLRLKKYIALRKLLSENTYGHRVKYMLSKICVNYEILYQIDPKNATMQLKMGNNQVLSFVLLVFKGKYHVSLVFNNK